MTASSAAAAAVAAAERNICVLTVAHGGWPRRGLAEAIPYSSLYVVAVKRNHIH